MKRKVLATLVAFVLMIGMIIPVSVSADGPGMTVPLYAGQDWEIGTVTVTNDADNIYVTYDMKTEVRNEGWEFVELHLAVEICEEDLPQNKKGNPEPGHFEFDAFAEYGDELFGETFTVEIPDEFLEEYFVYIAAHASIKMVDCVVNAEAPYGCETVDYEQGLTYSGGAVWPEHTAPESVGIYETGRDWDNFISLGFQSEIVGEDTAWIIVEFDNPIQNKDGNDVLVVEDTYGPYPVEKGLVEASQNGTDWVELGITSTRVGNPDQVESYFDLGSLEWARFIRVSDRSVKSDFASAYGDPNGFDLNAVISLQDNTTCNEYTESAWADGTRFVEKGSWATYFKYELDQVRVLLETVEVQSENGEGADSVTVLEVGSNYELTAHGTFTYVGTTWADPEYYLKGGVIVKGDTEGSKPYVLDISIDGMPSNIDWGEYNPLHSYTIGYSPTVDSTLHLFIYDSNWSDNHGSLYVDIFEILY